MLKDIPFYRTNHEDAYKHTDEVLDITNYFYVPNVPNEFDVASNASSNFQRSSKRLDLSHFHLEPYRHRPTFEKNSLSS